MLDPISKQVRQWRRLAMECRTYADQMRDADVRASFERTAQKYDRSADTVARRASKRSPSLHANMQSGEEVSEVWYYLVHRFGQVDAFEYSNLSFPSQKDAMAHACSLIATGELGNFMIKDGESRVVADDAAIKAYCKASE